MARCIQIASNGIGNVAPNPMVGCVIVHDDKIIGEGYHIEYGKAHAEVNAINSVKDLKLLKKSTLYVNLEPCAHFGKTPPCADLIVKHQIPQVVIGCKDTFSKVAGKGIEKLEKAACKVKVGVLENESRELNKRFFTFHEEKRPYVILKWAQTLDGFIDKERDEKYDIGVNWITDPSTKMLVHKWRSEESAIMVGTNTALNDNPSLNVREWSGNDPLRIVIDKDLKLPANINLFDKKINTLVLTEKIKKPENNLEFFKIDFKKDIIKQLFDILYERNIQSLFVEGGKTLLESFLNSGLWDEARVFIGNKLFYKGIKGPGFPDKHISTENIGDDKLLFFRNKI